MESLIMIDGKPVTLTMSDFDEEIDADSLVRVNYENLAGDAITVSALLNKVGNVVAQAEESFSLKKLEFEIYEANLKKGWRREAIENAGKFIPVKNKEGNGDSIKLTEKSIEEAVYLDATWQIKKKNSIKAQSNLSKIQALYWGVQSKDKKLNNLMSGLSEKELWTEIVEDSINTILIKKRKSITERKFKVREK